MTVSTRGRYALRVMLDLAAQPEGWVPMKEVAARQGISLKYIERITPALVKAGLIEGAHGKGGGYRLAVDPKSCTVGTVLRLTEGDLAPVSCLRPGAPECPRKDKCKTLPMWIKLKKVTEEYLDGVTLEDLGKEQTV